ncbi:MAG TPA: SEC-C metal-binding domain-containing protein [Solirubrobacteraceae bacterium]|nr:SEC-C metal-binding domain-containing protein [Solirubrobacteraceae bacterium]
MVSSGSDPTLTPTDAVSGGRGVRRLTGPVFAYVLEGEKPLRYAGFKSFSCGDPALEAVEEVQDTVRRLSEGNLRVTQTPVVVEDAAGALIGFCSVHTRSHPYPASPWIAERYVVAFGRDVQYYGYALRDGTTHVGEVLLRAGLDMIAGEAPGAPMPAVSALVRPENGDSRRVLQALGFDLHPATETGYEQDLLWREPGRPLPPALGLEVYAPPIAPAVRPRRNDPCPCGSGRKYKKCCGPRAAVHRRPA